MISANNQSQNIREESETASWRPPIRGGVGEKPRPRSGGLEDMGRGFITVFAEIGGNRSGLMLTRNESMRAMRRFLRHVEKTRKDEIRDKRALTIDNGKSNLGGRR